MHTASRGSCSGYARKRGAAASRASSSVLSIRRWAGGGAALNPEIGRGLATLGLEVYEGYGMTETAPIIAFTRPGDYIPGCCGLPL
ncbi:AMP-binding protein, partial [Erwinia amylovora]|uniref:AMP-binding protein n=1 Tax=Erwinia amylovora TaxID=552 RepID=UPI003D6EA352